ncbi:MAG: hypothetical protein J6B77_08540, partial [Clostridia bacterium]|nr:hypothetical protein [Clostridia bacterium]
MKRIIALFVLMLLIVSTVACASPSAPSAKNDIPSAAPQETDIPEEDPMNAQEAEQPEPAPSEEKSTVAEENEEKDEDTQEETLEYCGPMPGMYDSIQEMHASFLLGWSIDESNAMYSTYSTNNLFNVSYYYVPADIEGFYLFGILVEPEAILYTYYPNDCTDPYEAPYVSIDIGIKRSPATGEGDALTSLEQKK